MQFLIDKHSFMDFRGPGDYDSATFHTEFEITE